MKYGSVIVADRHQDLLEGVRGLLDTTFDTVVMVADKPSLFRTIEQIKPELAVVDLSIPVSGEINIARQLKDSFPNQKFIILSVHDEKTVIDEVLSNGISGFVLKRSIATDLVPAIEKVLQGGVFVSSLLEYRI